MPLDYIIDPFEVESKLRRIDARKSSGPDELPNWFLKEFSVLLAETQAQKLANVVSIPKGCPGMGSQDRDKTRRCAVRDLCEASSRSSVVGYLNSLISNRVTASRMSHRSSTRSPMAVPRTNAVCTTSTSRYFSMCALVVWNSLAPEIHLCSCLKTF